MFEHAFAVRRGSRPTAGEWARALQTPNSNLTPCPRVSNHHVSVEGTLCLRCRIESATGRPIFPGGSLVASPGRSAALSKLFEDADSVLNRAKRHAGDTVIPMWSRSNVRPSEAARKLLVDDGVLLSQQRTKIYAVRLANGDGRKYIERHDAACLTATRALGEWRTRLGICDIAKRADGLRGYLDRVDRIHRFRTILIAQATARAADKVASGIMAQEKLETARIAGIGTGLCEHLVRNGITNAADINRPHWMPLAGSARAVSLPYYSGEMRSP